MQRILTFLKNGKWKQMKKSDWFLLALAGVLLLVIALPSGESGGETGADLYTKTQSTREKGEREEPKKEERGGDYTKELEKKLETVLQEMEGVGKVTVMITAADAGEYIVEKDTSGTATTTTETDSGGGKRTVSENNSSMTTVYVEKGDEMYPYIQKEKMPAIEGVVVVAEGGGSSKVVSDISEAVKALFSIEAHRIKVVKMCSKED